MSSNNKNDISNFNTEMLNLFTKLNENKTNIKLDEYDNNNFSCHMDMCSILSALETIYNGTAGEKRKDLDENTNLNNILKIIPKAAQYSRRGIFIRNDYNYYKSFTNLYEKEAYIGNIPQNEKEKDQINKLIEKKFPQWLDKEDFLQQLFVSRLILYIKNESYFKIKSKYGKHADPDETRESIFYCGEGKSRKVLMMECIDVKIYNYYCKDIDTTFIYLNYKQDNNNNYKMFISMPMIPHTKQELIQFCQKNLNGDQIYKYMSKLKPVEYDIFLMPKFHSECRWQLRECTDDDSYLSKLLDVNSMDFSNIAIDMKGNNNNNNLIELKIISKIDNDEFGLSLLPATEFDDPDMQECCYFFPYTLCLDKSFLYIIMNKENVITNIGIFVGKDEEYYEDDVD